ncbi:MAG: hypothetical protein CL927_10035 [Deltaproteobacteria bacterium]|nr:hypothetical protein [Deltaproteobacteria bacterium]HCH61513.1 hypothetical protein [Deltaproteobacteria bacterium]
MSAPHLGAQATQLPPLPTLAPRSGEATIAVHDEGDHLAVYMAPAPLGVLVPVLAPDTPTTVWDAMGQLLPSGAALPSAGEALEGRPTATIPASLRAHPRVLLAAGHEWVLCAEDGVHATLFARRASTVLRAVHATVAHLVSGSATPAHRIDPRILGRLSRPSFRGAHRLRLDSRDRCLWVRSPGATVALTPDARGTWRIVS